MRVILLALWAMLTAVPAFAAESPLQALQTADDTRGWEAVGRLDIGNSFCTGTLIAPQIVLTAAHCLFDQRSSARYLDSQIEFLAGWRNGRAVAYRGIRRSVVHPDYRYEGPDTLTRVAYDLAFLELDQPIRLPSVQPFATGGDPMAGDEVGIVSYAYDRADAPSLQKICHVLGRQPGVLVMSCNVDFGSSGAPVFAMRDGHPSLVSVVSAKAELDQQMVALGTAMEQPLAELRAIFSQGAAPVVRSATGSTGAKFITP